MNDKRQIFFNCDERYLNPLRVVVYSVLKNARADRPLTVFIAHNRGFAQNGCRERISELCARFPFSKPVFLECDDVLNRHREILASQANVWSPVIWAGPLLTDVLPGDVTGNVVCLDVDMLVRHDLEPLFSLDLEGEGKIAAAVNEGERFRFTYLEACEWPAAAGDYFNNGTLVVNVDAYRREGIPAKIIDWYAKYKPQARFTDQDAQNAIFGDRTIRLSPEWNYNDGWLHKATKYNPFAATWRSYRKADILRAIADPAVVHFINRKPWVFSHRPERGEYHRYMKALGIFDDALNGSGPRQRLELVLYDAFHALLRLYAKALLALCRR